MKFILKGGGVLRERSRLMLFLERFIWKEVKGKESGSRRCIMYS